MHRAYHAMPPLTAPDGRPIGAVYGFLNLLVGYLEDHKPTHVVICFDRKEKTFRQILFSLYQAQRPGVEDDLSVQFGIIRDVLEAAHFVVYDKAGYEADDLIGTVSFVAGRGRKPVIDETIIVTGDKDQLQLVDSRVSVLMPTKGVAKSKLYHKEDVTEKMGVKPEQIIDYKALVGDPSDNYPGVNGIGHVTAVKLLNEYGSLENVYTNLDKIPLGVSTKLKANKSNAFLSQKLAKIIRDVEIELDFESFTNWDLSGKKVTSLYKELGFRSLAVKLGNTHSTKENFEAEIITKKKLTLRDVSIVSTILTKKLPADKWAIRGSAGLTLQGIKLNIDDVDIVCDKETALSANDTLNEFLVEKVHLKTSGKFKSYYGVFVIKGIQVEFMGDWQIKNKSGNWSRTFSGIDKDCETIQVGRQMIKVVNPRIELEMFALMGRWNTYHKIRKSIEISSQQKLF